MKLFLPAKDTKTSMFLRPLLDLDLITQSASYLGTYLGDATLRGQEATWEDKLYVAFRGEVAPLFDQYMRRSPRFVNAYSPQEGDTLYVFELSEDEVAKIVKPFTEGKYSEVDRDYVSKHFPNNPSHRLYGNRLVFDRSEIMRKAIENELGVTLAKGAEVWSKPKLENELYGFKKLDEESAPIPQS